MEHINVETVSYKVSVMLKNIGFPQDLFNTGWYNELGTLNGRTDINKDGQEFRDKYPEYKHSLFCPTHLKEEFNLEDFSAPTHAVVEKWFEEHGIYVSALPYRNIEDGIDTVWYSVVVDITSGDDIFCNAEHLGASEDNFETRYEALDDAVKRGCELLKEKI